MALIHNKAKVRAFFIRLLVIELDPIDEETQPREFLRMCGRWENERNERLSPIITITPTDGGTARTLSLHALGIGRDYVICAFSKRKNTEDGPEERGWRTYYKCPASYDKALVALAILALSDLEYISAE